MSQRNWKIAQRKTRVPLSNSFTGSSLLMSIRETGMSVSTTSHSMQSSVNSSTHSNSSKTRDTPDSTEIENGKLMASSNNIFQIIEEDCYHNEIPPQEQEAKMNEVDKMPPKSAFLHNHALNGPANNAGGKNYEDEGRNEAFDEDEDAPIIYHRHHDDSVSQITRSIAGNSMF